MPNRYHKYACRDSFSLTNNNRTAHLVVYEAHTQYCTRNEPLAHGRLNFRSKQARAVYKPAVCQPDGRRGASKGRLISVNNTSQRLRLCQRDGDNEAPSLGLYVVPCTIDTRKDTRRGKGIKETEGENLLAHHGRDVSTNQGCSGRSSRPRRGAPHAGA